MDVGVIVYTAQFEAPALREIARRILETEAIRFGVPLGRDEVLRRRAQGGSAMHVMAAADELVRHLGAESDPLREDSPLMVLGAGRGTGAAEQGGAVRRALKHESTSQLAELFTLFTVKGVSAAYCRSVTLMPTVRRLLLEPVFVRVGGG